MNTTIAVLGNDEPVQFAARELQRYLRLATRQPVALASHGSRAEETDLIIGIAGDLGIRPPSNLGPEDDWILIERRGGRTVITGVNGRSVLFAAYRYLRELGFRWIRPGNRGDVIPRLKTPLPAVRTIREQPAYRFRTICIEGATSEQHVLDLIDWLAKHGMNGYFIQFDLGTCFWTRWYQHPQNPYLRREPFDQKRAVAVVQNIIRAIQIRGLRFERMGHGWTCATLGAKGESWGKISVRRLAPEKRRWLAQVKGKRDLWYGVPLNTNLCYSNPQVRSTFADQVVAYARKHPEVTALHIWLADGSNNNCECRNCRHTRTSDFYVRILNEVDAKLAAAGLNTRIVFLIYVDLMWPPVREKIHNPDRFILMFAPITRSYRQSFADAGKGAARMKPYALNKLEFPKGATENLAYLHAWQKVFKGDGFDFDYHLIWACYYDFSLFNLTRVLHEDIRRLKDVGLHGLNSCQVQRLSFPHNLPFEVMARTLWNRALPFDRLVADHFSTAYGKDWRKAASFFDRTSRWWAPFFEPVYINNAVFQPTNAAYRNARAIEAGLRNIPRICALAQRMKPVVRRNLRSTEGAVQWSWRYLEAYLRLLEKLIPFFEAYLRASPSIRARYKEVEKLLFRLETTLHPALDALSARNVLHWRVHEQGEYLKALKAKKK